MELSKSAIAMAGGDLIDELEIKRVQCSAASEVGQLSKDEFMS
jgi:hypothetical protein